MITSFIDKNLESKKICDNYRTVASILESVDTVVFLGATTTSLTLAVTGVGLIVVLMTAGVAGDLTIGEKVIHKIILKKFIWYKKYYKKNQQTIESSNKKYTENVYKITQVIKVNMNLYVMFSMNMLMKRKIIFFYK